MDPVSIGLLLASTALTAFGTFKSYQGSEAQSTASRNIAQLEIQQDAIRRESMEVQARRGRLEVLRNVQRARSLALASAEQAGTKVMGSSTNTGLLGGYGQISGQAVTELQGINFNERFGERMFDTNALIGQQRMAYADAGGTVAAGQGIQAIGGALSRATPEIRALSQGFGTPMTSGGWQSFGGGIAAVNNNAYGVY